MLEEIDSQRYRNRALGQDLPQALEQLLFGRTKVQSMGLETALGNLRQSIGIQVHTDVLKPSLFDWPGKWAAAAAQVKQHTRSERCFV